MNRILRVTFVLAALVALAISFASCGGGAEVIRGTVGPTATTTTFLPGNVTINVGPCGDYEDATSFTLTAQATKNAGGNGAGKIQFKQSVDDGFGNITLVNLTGGGVNTDSTGTASYNFTFPGTGTYSFLAQFVPNGGTNQAASRTTTTLTVINVDECEPTVIEECSIPGSISVAAALGSDDTEPTNVSSATSYIVAQGDPDVLTVALSVSGCPGAQVTVTGTAKSWDKDNTPAATVVDLGGDGTFTISAPAGTQNTRNLTWTVTIPAGGTATHSFSTSGTADYPTNGKLQVVSGFSATGDGSFGTVSGGAALSINAS